MDRDNWIYVFGPVISVNLDFVVSGVVVVFISIFSFFVVNHGTGFTLVIVIDLFVIVFVVYLFNLCF